MGAGNVFTNLDEEMKPVKRRFSPVPVKYACSTHFFYGSPAFPAGTLWDEGQTCPERHHDPMTYVVTDKAPMVEALTLCGCKAPVKSMTQVVGFPYCCGASILQDLYGATAESIKTKLATYDVKGTRAPGAIFAISTEMQKNAEAALEPNGFVPISKFRNRYHSGGGVLTLWQKIYPEVDKNPKPKPAVPEVAAVPPVKKRITRKRQCTCKTRSDRMGTLHSHTCYWAKNPALWR